MVVQQYSTVFDIIDVCTYLVHAIRWSDGYHVVNPRIAEYPIGDVDSLVGTIAQENHILRNALHLLQHTFQFALQWIGITVVRGVVWILVGIQEHMSFLAGIFITGRGVGR